jgi:hypothetical protein
VIQDVYDYCNKQQIHQLDQLTLLDASAHVKLSPTRYFKVGKIGLLNFLYKQAFLAVLNSSA